MMTQKRRKKITSLDQFPDFDKMSYEEEAKWWETHDLSAVWDQLEEVEVKFVPGAFDVPEHLRQLTSAINVRLDPNDHQKLRAIANKKGVGIATLARMWILEHINAIEKFSSLHK